VSVPRWTLIPDIGIPLLESWQEMLGNSLMLVDAEIKTEIFQVKY
jgi:hypothetical protein